MQACICFPKLTTNWASDISLDKFYNMATNSTPPLSEWFKEAVSSTAVLCSKKINSKFENQVENVLKPEPLVLLL